MAKVNFPYRRLADEFHKVGRGKGTPSEFRQLGYLIDRNFAELDQPTIEPGDSFYVTREAPARVPPSVPTPIVFDRGATSGSGDRIARWSADDPTKLVIVEPGIYSVQFVISLTPSDGDVPTGSPVYCEIPLNDGGSLGPGTPNIASFGPTDWVTVGGYGDHHMSAGVTVPLAAGDVLRGVVYHEEAIEVGLGETPFPQLSVSRFGAGVTEFATTVFDPPALSNSTTTQWWAEDITVADGAAVSTWAPRADQLGLGSLAQGTAANRPVFDAVDAGGSGAAAVVFDGVNDSLATTTLGADITGRTEIIVIGRLRTATSAQVHLFNGAPGKRRSIAGNAGTWYLYQGAANIGASPQSTRPQMFRGVFDTVDEFYLDESLVASGDAGTEAFTRLSLGVNAGGIADWSPLSISYVVVVNGTLNATDLAELKEWAARHYSIVF